MPSPLRPSLEVTDPRELIPPLFDQHAERSGSGGQLSAAALVALVLLAVEGLTAPYILAVTAVAAVASWVLLNSSVSGRRRSSRRRRLSSRVLYISTLFLLGLWLVTMLLFKMATPVDEIPDAPRALPQMMFGMDLRMLTQMARPERVSGAAFMARPSATALSPFSLLVHGAASTLAVNLLAYVAVSYRRRIRRARSTLTSAGSGR